MTLAATQYHRETSYRRDRMGGPSLDWANQPGTFKSYPTTEPLPLPREADLPDIPLSRVIRGLPPSVPPQPMTAAHLARLFLLTYSLTAKARHPGGDFYYRTAASAGALYPTEIYGAFRGVAEVEDGLYHFSIAPPGLDPVTRRGFFLLSPPVPLRASPALFRGLPFSSPPFFSAAPGNTAIGPTATISWIPATYWNTSCWLCRP